jgi:hypothetical protein
MAGGPLTALQPATARGARISAQLQAVPCNLSPVTRRWVPRRSRPPRTGLARTPEPAPDYFPPTPAAAYVFRSLRTRTPYADPVTELAPPKRARWLAPAALAAALLSLALNGVLLYLLQHPERLLAPALDRVLGRLEAQDATLRYQVRIPAGMPVHFDIPVDERYEVRLNTTIPINTTLNLPIETPFGRRNVTVPVRTNIPLRTNVPIHLRDTFRLRTQTQAEIVVPLEIPIRDLPLDELRQSLKP